MPSMDTPSIKSNWSATVRASKNITNVFMSGVKINKTEQDSYYVYNFV